MTQADTRDSTPLRFTPKIVGGTDLSAAPSNANLTPREKRRRERQLQEPLTETGRNQRKRQSRRDAWQMAERLTHFRAARMDWESALTSAQMWGVEGASNYSEADVDRWMLVEQWRNALVSQMLTPAPDQAAINWKRGALRKGQWRYIADVTERQLHAAIDADVAWLAAHPSRKSVAATRRQS